MPVVDFNMQTEGKLNSMVLTPVFTNKPSSPSLHPHSSLSRTLLQADVATWIVVCYSSTAQQRQTSQMFITSLPYSTICNKCADIFQKNATLVFVFNLMHLSTYLFFCVFISPSFYSVFICSKVLCVYLYFIIFSSLLFFYCLSPIQQLWEQCCFHHSCHFFFCLKLQSSHINWNVCVKLVDVGWVRVSGCFLCWLLMDISIDMKQH